MLSEAQRGSGPITYCGPKVLSHVQREQVQVRSTYREE